MAPCLHLDTAGRRCPREAEPERPFCRGHDPASEPAMGLGPDLRRLFLRLAALLLLLAFLVPLVVHGYRLLQDLFH